LEAARETHTSQAGDQQIVYTESLLNLALSADQLLDIDFVANQRYLEFLDQRLTPKGLR
jgi:hypothetical protein